MRKIFDGSVLALCVLTIINTDYTSISALDIAVFACMGIAVAAVSINAIMQRRRNK